MPNRNTHRHHRRKWLLLALLIVVLAVGGATALHIKNTHKAQRTSGPIPTVSKDTKTTTTTVAPKGDGPTLAAATTTPASTTTPSTTTPSGEAPTVPYGNFVSTHTPGSNDTELSVCNTTAGATCEIQFTNASGVVKSLGAKQTDANGSASWSWTVNGATLSPGNWTIKAVATFNGKTTSAEDSLQLQVQ